MSLGKRLRQARTQLGYTQKQLAQAAGCSQQSINAIERGESTLPRKLLQIAASLNITPEWLQYGVDTRPKQPKIIPSLSGVHFIPMIDWPLLGERLTLGDNFTNYNHLIPIPIKFNRNCFALEITDKSMISSVADEMSFLPGAIIVVDPEKKPANGDYIIAWSSVLNTALLRRYKKYNNTFYLYALNSENQDEKLTANEVKIVGKVIHVSRDL